MAHQGGDPHRAVTVDDVLVPRVRTTRMMVRAFTKRCPRCGSGHLFRRWFDMADNCPGCGYLFERGDEGFFLGSYLVNLCVSEGLVFVFFVVLILRLSANPDASVGVLFGVGIFLAVFLPIFFYPFSRTIWAALHLANDPLELHEIVGALDALERNEPPADAVEVGDGDGVGGVDPGPGGVAGP